MSAGGQKAGSPSRRSAAARDFSAAHCTVPPLALPRRASLYNEIRAPFDSLKRDRLVRAGSRSWRFDAERSFSASPLGALRLYSAVVGRLSAVESVRLFCASHSLGPSYFADVFPLGQMGRYRMNGEVVRRRGNYNEHCAVMKKILGFQDLVLLSQSITKRRHVSTWWNSWAVSSLFKKIIDYSCTHDPIGISYVWPEPNCYYLHSYFSSKSSYWKWTTDRLCNRMGTRCHSLSLSLLLTPIISLTMAECSLCSSEYVRAERVCTYCSLSLSLSGSSDTISHFARPKLPGGEPRIGDLSGNPED